MLGTSWSATSFDNGDIVCHRSQSKQEQLEPPSVRLGLEVHHQKLMSIAEEMGRVFQDSSLSTNIREARFLMCCLRCIRTNAGTRCSYSCASWRIASQRCGSNLKLQSEARYGLHHQRPFSGGTHLPDVTIVRPVFVDSLTTPAFFVANRAHHSDVGGVTPGSLPIATRTRFPDGLTILEEGFRIEASELTDAVIERFAETSRLPMERRADLAAQIAANDSAERRLCEWARHRSLKGLIQFNTALLAYTQKLAAKWIAAIPEGKVLATEYLEGDGLTETPIAIRLALTRMGHTVTFDFTESDGMSRSSLNAVKAITRSAVFYTVKLMNPSIPANDGLMQNIHIHTRLGSIVDARSPAAVSAGNVETSQRIVDTILSGFAQFFPTRVPAQSCGSMNNVLLGGIDQRHAPGRPFVHYETLGGGAGAGPNGHGADAIHTHMTNTLNTPIEVFERRFPIIM